MQLLDLDNAQAGMVLGEDAVGVRGQLLLRTGTVLNDRHLQMLRANAVAHIRVDISEAVTPCRAEHHVTDIETHIEARFSLCDDQHPLVQELRRLCRQRLTRAHEGPDDD